MKNKKLMYIAIAVIVMVTGIIAFRIYTNISLNKQRASKASQGRTVAVEVAKVNKRDLIPVMSFSANLEPKWSADISPKVEGRIDKLYVDEGDRVSAGQIIAVLDTNELAAQVSQARGNWYAAQANLEQAEADLRRMEALASQGAVSLQALDSARYKRDMALGQVNSAAGNVDLLSARLGNAEIISPKDGIVVKRFLQAGYYAKVATPIVTIADTSVLLAKANVGEAEIGQINVGLPVKVEVSAYPGQQFAGEITRISPMAALPARTFTAEINIPNENGILKAGMFAKAIVQGAVHKNIIAIPQSAIVMREDQKTVFVLQPDNTVRQVLLTLGYSGDGWIEVLEGLSEGDLIVTSGHNKLRDGMTVAANEVEGSN